MIELCIVLTETLLHCSLGIIIIIIQVIMFSPVFFSFGKGQKSHGAHVFTVWGVSKAVKCLIIWLRQFQWAVLGSVGSRTDVRTVIAINNLMNVTWRNTMCSQKLSRYGMSVSNLHHLRWLRYFSGCNRENCSGKTVVLGTELERERNLTGAVWFAWYLICFSEDRMKASLLGAPSCKSHLCKNNWIND
jgi:hypothetical protein